MQVLAVNPEGYYFLLNMDAQKNIRSIQPVQLSGQLSNLQKTKAIGNSMTIPLPSGSAAGSGLLHICFMKYNTFLPVNPAFKMSFDNQFLCLYICVYLPS